MSRRPSTDADVESYVIGDATGNSISVVINASTQSVTATAATDNVTFSLGSVTSFTGTITGEGTAVDTLSLEDGDSVVGATISGVVRLAIDGGATSSVSMDLADFASLTALNGAGGADTEIVLDGAGASTVFATGIEHYVLTGTGAQELDTTGTTDTERAGIDIDLQGASANIVVGDDGFSAGGVDFLEIFGFDAGADTLEIFANDVDAQNGGFQSISASNTTLNVGANSIVEIQTGVGQAISFTDITNAESLVANAIGAADGGTLTNADFLTVVLYSGGDAGVYTLDLTTVDSDLQAADFDLELIAVVQDVGANNIDATNFL